MFFMQSLFQKRLPIQINVLASDMEDVLSHVFVCDGVGQVSIHPVKVSCHSSFTCSKYLTISLINSFCLHVKWLTLMTSSSTMPAM